jgi:hypothetical protein
MRRATPSASSAQIFAKEETLGRLLIPLTHCLEKCANNGKARAIIVAVTGGGEQVRARGAESQDKSPTRRGPSFQTDRPPSRMAIPRRRSSFLSSSLRGGARENSGGKGRKGGYEGPPCSDISIKVAEGEVVVSHRRCRRCTLCRFYTCKSLTCFSDAPSSRSFHPPPHPQSFSRSLSPSSLLRSHRDGNEP